MNTCGSCKHWGDEKDADEAFRACRAVIHDENYAADKEALTNRHMPQAKEFQKSHVAVVQDGSGYAAWLRCREDFGCVLWESA
jgi:hypothetical protein